MKRNFEVADYEYGKHLEVWTPGAYSMDLAVKILEHLEKDYNALIPNTGWKDGFGLEVAAGIPIEIELVSLILTTDGSEIDIKRVSGSKHMFDSIAKTIQELAY